MRDFLEASDLREHFRGTYLTLRRALFVVAVSLPLVLWWGGLRLLEDPRLLGSLSEYYHSPMQDVFVGLLFFIAALLFTYKGFSKREDWALNFASFFLIGVALIPMQDTPVHGILAGAFFLCMAYVCVFRALDTLRLIKNDQSRSRYRRWYRGVGALLVLSPAIAAILDLSSDGESKWIFWAEACAVWCFSLFWLIKGVEIRQTNAEQRAADGEVRRDRGSPRAWDLLEVDTPHELAES